MQCAAVSRVEVKGIFGALLYRSMAVVSTRLCCGGVRCRRSKRAAAVRSRCVVVRAGGSEVVLVRAARRFCSAVGIAEGWLECGGVVEFSFKMFPLPPRCRVRRRKALPELPGGPCTLLRTSLRLFSSTPSHARLLTSTFCMKLIDFEAL